MLGDRPAVEFVFDKLSEFLWRSVSLREIDGVPFEQEGVLRLNHDAEDCQRQGLVFIAQCRRPGIEEPFLPWCLAPDLHQTQDPARMGCVGGLYPDGRLENASRAVEIKPFEEMSFLVGATCSDEEGNNQGSVA